MTYCTPHRAYAKFLTTKRWSARYRASSANRMSCTATGIAIAIPRAQKAEHFIKMVQRADLPAGADRGGGIIAREP